MSGIIKTIILPYDGNLFARIDSAFSEHFPLFSFIVKMRGNFQRTSKMTSFMFHSSFLRFVQPVELLLIFHIPYGWITQSRNHFSKLWRKQLSRSCCSLLFIGICFSSMMTSAPVINTEGASKERFLVLLHESFRCQQLRAQVSQQAWSTCQVHLCCKFTASINF